MNVGFQVKSLDKGAGTDDLIYATVTLQTQAKN